MQAEHIQKLIETEIPESRAEVQLEGNHVHLRVESPAFIGVSPVKKQQMIYALLSEPLASGAIHAVHMQTLTPEEL